MRETASVAATLGLPIEDKAPFPSGQVSEGTEDEAVVVLNRVGEALGDKAPQHRMSTLQDVERRQRLEIEETLGHTVREGERLGVRAPTVKICYRLLGSIDRSLDGRHR